MLVSGLEMGSSWCDQLKIEMLVDYITGQLGGAEVSKCIIELYHLSLLSQQWDL